ncbi:uncharacterized protein SPSC_04288 [Sporisorium scitamineum]|uniref:Chromatin modification-related protein n=1 Tax=Sporisorium scitamineum TaxID=49012 RepID=A0A0F7SAA7_9BASI|nr:uncharacterized protein SPSC_04288 [Sporisorium scitamineum]CDW97725.1 hypothetical protein [Sporisorium scitamineum]
MSSAGSPRKQAPSSPSKRLKRKTADTDDLAGPSTSAGRSRTSSTSPFHPDSASSSTTPSPVKRASISSSSRRNSRSARTFQVSVDFDQDGDAPYDEGLDADGEYDEEYFGQDAQAEEDDEDVEEVIAPRASSSTRMATPARQSARPKRSNAPNVSYYAVQPLPSPSDNEQDEEATPSIRRRGRKAKLLSTSDIDVDMDDDDEDREPAPARSSSRGTRTNTPSTSKQSSGKAPRRPIDQDAGEQHKSSSAKPPEPEMSEEAKQQAKAEKEAHDLQSRWTEEYFEIVEQLPLEMHRTFALMRELEGQMQARVGTMVQDMAAYRDVRMEMQKRLDATPQEQADTSEDQSSSRKSVRGGSEDEAETLLGGSQDGQRNGQPSARQDGVNDVEVSSVDGVQSRNLFDKDARRQLLRSISLAANESVKAAEEKMGLAATAYNWIDRHIRRLDADISKLESSILLGLRSGTEESRNAREALGLPVDDLAEDAEPLGEDGDAQAGEGISAEAESAALTKAAGAARRASASGAEAAATGGRRSARTTPKMGGQAQLAPSPKSQRTLSRSRSRSASTSAGGAVDKSTAPASSTNRAGRQKTTSPAPPLANTRTTRKRKPKPLSPQKGGRRSIITTTPTIVSPTTQLPRSTGTIVGPDTSEMPFDPTEPTYCYCDQISFDEMVACDNEDCTIEWFHYACVGLTRQPKNEWFCRFCAPTGWKGEGMAVPANAKHRPPGFRKGVGIKA